LLPAIDKISIKFWLHLIEYTAGNLLVQVATLFKDI